MDEADHLQSREYLSRGPRRGGLPLRAHTHLVEACPECGESWAGLGETLRGVVREKLQEVPLPAPPALPCRDDLSGRDEAVDALAAQARKLRHLRRRAKKQLSELRGVPAARRPAKVRGAYRRFRSRLLAELLIDEARQVVRNAPAEAMSFASLVPLVLDWARGDRHAAWAPTLVTRALAHEANALRVSGDLSTAQQIFEGIDIRQIPEPAARAEVLSLEASLRIDRRQFRAAERTLQGAAQIYQYVNDPIGKAKVQIKMANLLQVLFRTEEVLTLFELADRDLPAHCDPSLKINTVTGRVNALCDLKRPGEARVVLHEGLDAFEELESPYVAGVCRFLEGRICLGFQDYSAAIGYFEDSANAMQLIGRHLDAASASLYLAEALLAEGRIQEIKGLAASLIGEFRRRRIEGEALKAIHIFSRAVATEQLSVALLVDIRRRILVAK